MTAEEAQKKIAQMHIDHPYNPPTEGQLSMLSSMRVDYWGLKDFPHYKFLKIMKCVEWIRAEYDPKEIWLVCSQLNGHPTDEETTQEMFDLKKEILGKTKLSDWDFVIAGEMGETFQRIEQISPLIKLDLFNYHHGNVRKLSVYKKQ